MSYQALYRNFRPLKFSDMVGQEHITKTLRNQVMSGRVGHAYLFTGGRGTGKTTSAKILSRVVNCLNPQNGEPCNECEICKEILSGSLTDVVEMDAASNNSVEDIRAIRDEVNFLPTKAKYRVYIIDEVHMLSTGAFNALLKTLEEPPAHVKFILATTEPQKLPTTILSRCQRFDFKKISEPDIVKRLKIIADESNIKIEDDALKTIAVLSEGHMRDAISILERCSQESSENITTNEVKQLVGLPSLEYISKITKGIVDYDTMASLEVIDEVINDGKDLYNFLWEIIKYIKDILVFKTTNSLDLYSKEELVEIKNISDTVDEPRLLDIIYQLSDLENDIKWSSQKTIMFQTGIIKVCRHGGSVITADESALEKRLAELENKVEALKHMQNNNPPMVYQEPQTRTQPSGTRKPEEKRDKPLGSGFKKDELWKRIVEVLKREGKIRLYTSLINTKLNEVNDLVWEIQFPNGITSFNQKILDDPHNQSDLEAIVHKATGKEIHLKYIDCKKNVKKDKESKSGIDDLGFDINIID